MKSLSIIALVLFVSTQSFANEKAAPAAAPAAGTVAAQPAATTEVAKAEKPAHGHKAKKDKKAVH